MAIRQVIVSVVAALSLVASGMSLGFPAISLDQLQDHEGVSKDTGSWFASILSVAQVFGCLLCGPLLDTIGRRKTMIITSIPFIAGYAILCATPEPASLELLFVGRILIGIASGMVSIPACVYIGEMATKNRRGMLVTWPSVGMSTGILLVYLLGWIFKDNWRLVSGITIALPTWTSIFVFFYLKETPHWLLTRGREGEAEVSFKWIREVGKDMPKELQVEFDELVQNSRKNAKKHNQEIPHISTISNIMDNNPTFSNVKKKSLARKICDPLISLRSPDAWKPLVIHNCYFFFMQFGGIQVVASYAVDIMKEAKIQMDSYLATVLLGVVQLLGGIVASIVFNKFGRRPISLISGAGMTLTMIGLGVYLEVGDGSEDLSWLPLVLILGYIGFAAIGFNLIPWGLIGELYPTRVAGLSAGITTCIANLLGFAAIKLYPGFQDLMRGDRSATGGGFFFFGAVSCVGTFFIFFFLPETFKKSLQQIGEEFIQPSRTKFRCC